jgi:hypothetical protein
VAGGTSVAVLALDGMEMGMGVAIGRPLTVCNLPFPVILALNPHELERREYERGLHADQHRGGYLAHVLVRVLEADLL